jgi:ubiquitin carboxyl-terminal hydrolase 5/13
MKKLAITEEREEDKYDHLTTVKCWSCDPQNGVEMPDAPNDPKVPLLFFITSGSSLITKKNCLSTQ